MEAKRINDKRGMDNKITLKHPTSGQEIRTPWYYVPNITDFEISTKLGYNAALLILNKICSRAKYKEEKIPWTGQPTKGQSPSEFR